jgi:hypothetical protein
MHASWNTVTGTWDVMPHMHLQKVRTAGSYCLQCELHSSNTFPRLSSYGGGHQSALSEPIAQVEYGHRQAAMMLQHRLERGFGAPFSTQTTTIQPPDRHPGLTCMWTAKIVIVAFS